MTEPDVALTDYALALLCTWFILELVNTRRQNARPSFQAKMQEGTALLARRKAVHSALWILFFASIVAASLTGGTVHGFFNDGVSTGARILWPATLLATGVTSMSIWLLAGALISGTDNLRKWWVFASALFVIYAVVVLFYSQSFLVVLLNSLPATLTLLVAATVAYVKTKSSSHLWLIAGIVISIVAALIQQIGVAIHPDYFNHNSTYHLVQGLGFWTVFQSSKRAVVSK